jgi:hypothetical protein
MARAMAEYPDVESTLCAFSAADRQAVEGLAESDEGKTK